MKSLLVLKLTAKKEEKKTSSRLGWCSQLHQWIIITHTHTHTHAALLCAYQIPPCDARHAGHILLLVVTRPPLELHSGSISGQMDILMDGHIQTSHSAFEQLFWGKLCDTFMLQIVWCGIRLLERERESKCHRFHLHVKLHLQRSSCVCVCVCVWAVNRAHRT